MIINVKPLYERLTNKITKGKIFNNSINDWVMFIYDHKKYIKNNSDLVTITLEDKNKYKYMFKAFLRSKKYNQRIYWIVKIINNLEYTNEEFTSRDFLFIPTESFITELYRLYQTSKKIKK